MTPNPAITALLRHARHVALDELSGQPATLGPDGTLARAAEVLRTTILRQVAAGLWADQGIRDVGQMAGLRVEVAFGNELLGEAPLKIEWDFARTALSLLVVENERSS